MKIRIGFVSNSSSSSFIVIGDVEDCSYLLKPEIYDGADNGFVVFGTKGETDFGWGPETITDIYSRINFAYIQSENNPNWREMLEEVLKSTVSCDAIVWEINGYIDHQSHASSGANTELFDSKDTLRRFLFCDDSLIQLDNDNH
jgi:hypothetical protein